MSTLSNAFSKSTKLMNRGEFHSQDCSMMIRSVAMWSTHDRFGGRRGIFQLKIFRIPLFSSGEYSHSLTIFRRIFLRSIYIINKSMRTLWLVNQLWVIARLPNYYIKAIDHKFLWVIGRLTTWDVGRTLEEFVSHSPAACGLQILLVFCQHPAWFISL